MLILAIGAVLLKPPRYRILYWISGLLFLYEACIFVLRIVTPTSVVQTIEVFIQTAVSVFAILLVLVLIWRPIRLMYFVCAGLLAASLVQYVLAFIASDGGTLADTLALLYDPKWVLTLLCQIDLAISALALAGIASFRADIFSQKEKQSPQEIF